MRKILSFLTLFAMCTIGIGAQLTTADGIKYEYQDDGTASIVGYESTAVTYGALTIPAKCDGRAVSSIRIKDEGNTITKLIFNSESYDQLDFSQSDISSLQGLEEVEITQSNAYVQLRNNVKSDKINVTCPNLENLNNVLYAKYNYYDASVGLNYERYAAMDTAGMYTNHTNYIKIVSELNGTPVNKVDLQLPNNIQLVVFEGTLSYLDPANICKDILEEPRYLVCELGSYATLNTVTEYYNPDRDPFVYVGESVEESPVFMIFEGTSLVLCGAVGDHTGKTLSVSPAYTVNSETYSVDGINLNDYYAYLSNSSVTDVEFALGFGDVLFLTDKNHSYKRSPFPNANIVCNDYATYNAMTLASNTEEEIAPFDPKQVSLYSWTQGDFSIGYDDNNSSYCITSYNGTSPIVTIPFEINDIPVTRIMSLGNADNFTTVDFTGAQTKQMFICEGIDFTNFITIGLNKKVGEKKIIYSQNAGQQYDAIANGVLFYIETNPNLSTYNDAIASGYVGSESEIYVPKSVTIEEESVRVAGFEYKNMYYEGVTKVTFENYDTYRSALFDYEVQGVEFAFDTDKAIQTEELILIEDQYGSLTIIDYKDGLDVVTIKKEFTALDGKKYSLPDALQIPFLEKLKNVKVEGEFSSVSVDIIDDDNNEVIRSLDLTGITGHAKIGYNETFKQVIVRPDEQTQYTNETDSYYNYLIFFSNAKDYTGDLIPNPSDNVCTDDGLLLVVNYYDESEDELHLKLLGYAGDETKLSLPAYITINGRKAYIDDIASGLEEKFANRSVTSLTVALNAGESNNTFNASGLTHTFPNIQEVHCSDAIVYEAFINCDYLSDELKKNVSISLVAEDYNGFAIAYAGTGENEYAIMNYNGNDNILTVPFDYNGTPITLLMTLAPSDGSAEAGNFLVVDFSGNQKERMMVSGHDFENYTVVLPKDKMENKMVDIYYGPAETLSENPYLTSDGMVFRKEEDGNLTLIGFAKSDATSATILNTYKIDGKAYYVTKVDIDPAFEQNSKSITTLKVGSGIELENLGEETNVNMIVFDYFADYTSFRTYGAYGNTIDANYESTSVTSSDGGSITLAKQYNASNNADEYVVTDFTLNNNGVLEIPAETAGSLDVVGIALDSYNSNIQSKVAKIEYIHYSAKSNNFDFGSISNKPILVDISRKDSFTTETNMYFLDSYDVVFHSVDDELLIAGYAGSSSDITLAPGIKESDNYFDTDNKVTFAGNANVTSIFSFVPLDGQIKDMFPNLGSVTFNDLYSYGSRPNITGIEYALNQQEAGDFAIARYNPWDEDQYTIVGYEGNSSIITIPTYLDDNKVMFVSSLKGCQNSVVLDFSEWNESDYGLTIEMDALDFATDDENQHNNLKVLVRSDNVQLLDDYEFAYVIDDISAYNEGDGVRSISTEEGTIVIGFMPEAKSVSVSEMDILNICLYSPSIEDLTLNTTDEIMFDNFSVDLMPNLKKITLFSADMKGYFDDVLYGSGVEVALMQLKADNMTFAYSSNGLMLIDVDAETDFTCELKTEYTFDSIGTYTIASWMEVPAATMAKISYLGLPPTVMELMVAEDDEDNTLHSDYMTIGVSNAEELISVEPLQAIAKTFIVPSAMLESYQNEYPNIAHKFISADRLSSDNTNVEYDAETNTLAVTVDESATAANILADVATAVNAGAKNAENIVIRLTADIDMTQPDDKSSTWTSIGTTEAPFSGTFAGNGHTVTGLSSATGALFGVVGSEGRVDSLVIDATLTIDQNNAVVGNGTSEDGQSVTNAKWIGLLADVNNGNMSDIFATVDIDTDFDALAPDSYFAIVGENNGALDHVAVVVYVGSKESENKAVGSTTGQTIKVGNGGGNGGSITKCCLAKTRKLMQKSGTINYDVAECSPIEISKDLRSYDEAAWESGEAAYWFNFAGEGYSGEFTGKYTFRNNQMYLASNGSKATVRLVYDTNSDKATVSGKRFANLGTNVDVTYNEAPREITGATVKLLSDTEATLTLPTTLPDDGSVTIALLYDLAGEPANVATPEAEGASFVAIYDLAGRMVSDGDVSGLVSGLYVAVQADGARKRIAVK